jgi:hypothetical protein
MDKDMKYIPLDEQPVERKDFRLQNFDLHKGLHDIDHAPYIVLIAPRHSGKSVAISSIVEMLDKKWKYSNCFCFSQTAKMTKAFPFMKQENIFNSLDPLDQIIEIRKRSYEEGKNKKDHVLIILDDISNLSSKSKKTGKQKNVRYSESLDFASTTGRHYNLHFILALQSRSQASKTQRQNASMTFLWIPKSMTDRKMITDEYLGLLRDKTEKEETFQELYSVPYQALVVAGYKNGCTCLSDYCSKVVFPYPVPKFKMKHTKKRRSRRKSEFQKQIEENNQRMMEMMEKKNQMRIFNINLF